ncbi:MAG: carboxypeptidase regulatory-like domain-containing protein [Planctomycetota bacterium]
MRSRSILLGLLVVATIVALLVWTLAPRDARTRSSPGVPPSSTIPVTDAQPELPSAQDPGATPIASVDDDVTPMPPIAIDATRPLPHATRIVGRVTDPSGVGIRDARVLARAATSDELDATREVETTTDAAGRFEIAGLHPGPIELALSAASWAPRHVDGLVVPTGGALDAGDLALDLPVLLLGRVVDEAGRSIGGAHVLARNGDRTESIDERTAAITRADGGFACLPLACGAWTLDAIADGFVVAHASGFASPGETISDIEVELVRGPSILGHVTGADASELATLLVVARPVPNWTDPPLDPDESLPTAADSDARRTLGAALRGESSSNVDANGRFELAGLLSARTYEVVVGPRSAARTSTLTDRSTRAALGMELVSRDIDSVLARVRARPSALEIELALARPAQLAFELRSADTRTPIEDFVFVLAGAAPATLFDQHAEPLARHADGRVVLAGFRPLGGELCTLSVEALGHARASFSFAASAGRPTDLGSLLLPRTRTVTLRVRDAATDSPIHGAEVRAHEVDATRDAENGIAYATSDEQGVARVTTFDERGSRLTIAAPGFATLELPGPLERARDVFDVPMSAGASIVAHVASEDGDALPGVEVIVERPDPQSGNAWIPAAKPVWTGADGNAHWMRLTPDLQRVYLGPNDRVSDRDVALITLRAGETRELWLTATRTHALHVTVVDGRAPMAGVPVEFLDATASVRIAAAVTDAAGRARLPRVRRGEYALALTIDGNYGTRPASIGDGDAHLTIDVAESTLVGTVRSAGGDAVAGAEVAVESAFDAHLHALLDAHTIEASLVREALARRERDGRPRARAITDAAGRFRLRGLVPGQAYTVRAALGALETGAAQLESFDAESELVIPLSGSGALEIALRNVVGAQEPLLVVLRPAGDALDFARALAWDARAVVRVDGLVEGKWSVRTYAASSEPGVLTSFGSVREIDIQRDGVMALEIAWP